MTQITITELEAITQKLFDHLKSEGHSTIDLSVDYYWGFVGERRFNPYEQPSDPTLGQVSDEWKELTRIINGDREPFGYALVWLAGVLHAIGQEIMY